MSTILRGMEGYWKYIWNSKFSFTLPEPGKGLKWNYFISNLCICILSY